MNKDSKKFIKYVKRIIPIHSKDKLQFENHIFISGY